MKLWDGSYLSTKGVVAITIRESWINFMDVVYENGQRVTLPFAPTNPSYVEQIDAFAKEAGL